MRGPPQPLFWGVVGAQQVAARWAQRPPPPTTTATTTRSRPTSMLCTAGSGAAAAAAPAVALHSAGSASHRLTRRLRPHRSSMLSPPCCREVGQRTLQERACESEHVVQRSVRVDLRCSCLRARCPGDWPSGASSSTESMKNVTFRCGEEQWR